MHYKEMFYHEATGEMLVTDITKRDLYIEEESGEGTNEDLSEEYTITDGFREGCSYMDKASIKDGLLYELSVMEDRDMEPYRSYSLDTVMNQYCLNHIRSKEVVTEGLRGRRKTVYRYNLTSGTVSTMSGRGHGFNLNLSHFLLGRDGRKATIYDSVSLLPNIWDNGSTCHGGIIDTERWANNRGLTPQDPEAVKMSYLNFKGGRGNTDLLEVGKTRRITGEELLDIVEAYEEQYIPTIQNATHQYLIQEYTDRLKQKINESLESSPEKYSANLLAILLSDLEGFYIEDYL